MPSEDKVQVYIIIYNCQEKVNSYEELYEKKLEPIDFCGIIEKRFEKFIEKKGNHTYIIAPNYKAYCGGGHKLSSDIEIDIYGEEGLHEFISLSKEKGWQILDKYLNDLIDLNFAKEYSYEEYIEKRKSKAGKIK